MASTLDFCTDRSISLDLLRIVCMLMVVCQHALGHGGLIEGTLVPGSLNWYAGNILCVITKQAVNCFVLISGYFLCTARFRLKKLVTLWLQIFFYSVVVYLVLLALPLEITFSVKELMKCAMPFITDRYWFVSDYLLLYITFPFLNCAIRSMDRKTHLLCCGVLLLVFSILPNLVYVYDFTGINGGYSYTWFCVLYMLAAYIRLYVPKRIKHQKWMFPGYVLLSLVICGERFVATYLTPLVFGRVVLTSLFYSYNSMISVPCALLLFQGFRGMKLSSKHLGRIIGAVAPLTFAVYLIHEQDILRPILWECLNPAAWYDSPCMLAYVLACTVGIFVLCCVAEAFRRKLFAAIGITTGVQSLCDRIQSGFAARMDQLFLKDEKMSENVP